MSASKRRVRCVIPAHQRDSRETIRLKDSLRELSQRAYQRSHHAVTLLLDVMGQRAALLIRPYNPSLPVLEQSFLDNLRVELDQQPPSTLNLFPHLPRPPPPLQSVRIVRVWKKCIADWKKKVWSELTSGTLGAWLSRKDGTFESNAKCTSCSVWTATLCRRCGTRTPSTSWPTTGTASGPCSATPHGVKGSPTRS